MPTALPKRVWIFWNQGFEQAPFVVRLCLRSWKLRNPGWEVIALDATNLEEHVDRRVLSELNSLQSVDVVKFANLLRLRLMSQAGGVWADATCFCVEPLDDWLPNAMTSGFFAFRRRPDAWLERAAWPRRLFGSSGDRIVASWFLASLPGNAIPSMMFEAQLRLFATSDFSLQKSASGRFRRALIRPLFQRNAWLAQWWSHPVVIRFVRSYPYFIFHYQFARLLSQSAVFRTVWRATPVRYGGRLSGMNNVLLAPVDIDAYRKLLNSSPRVLKLKWRIPEPDSVDGTFIGELERSLSVGAES